MIPTVGRIVHYRMTEHGAAQIRQRRAASNGILVGNPVNAGDVYPLVITRVWGDTEGSAVNGQVLLDGNDTLWVTSATEGDGAGQWFTPPRV